MRDERRTWLFPNANEISIAYYQLIQNIKSAFYKAYVLIITFIARVFISIWYIDRMFALEFSIKMAKNINSKSLYKISDWIRTLHILRNLT